MYDDLIGELYFVASNVQSKNRRELLERAASAIEDLKTTAADVRPVVRGKWIPDYDYTEYDFDGITPLAEPWQFQDGWRCNQCEQYMPHETNFCPNCGADMREES